MLISLNLIFFLGGRDGRGQAFSSFFFECLLIGVVQARKDVFHENFVHVRLLGLSVLTNPPFFFVPPLPWVAPGRRVHDFFFHLQCGQLDQAVH